MDQLFEARHDQTPVDNLIQLTKNKDHRVKVAVALNL